MVILPVQQQLSNSFTFIDRLKSHKPKLPPFPPKLLIIKNFRHPITSIDSSKSHEPAKLPPSPPKLPIIGNLHHLHTPLHRSFRALSNKYGPLMILQMGHVPVLVVSSAEMAHEIIKNQDIAFANRPSMLSGNLLLYGSQDIVFAEYGEYLREMKKICVAELLNLKRVQSFKLIREEENALMVKTISLSSAHGASINLTEMLLAMSSSIVTRCALGTKHERFGELSRELLGLIGAFSFGDWFPWLGWVDGLTGLVTRMNKVSRELDVFFDKVIDEHLAQRKDDDAKRTKDFVDLLIDAQENNVHNFNFNRNNIKAIILDMFVGGTDTTSTTEEWAIAELVKNPNVMKKAQEEVRRVVGNKSKVDEEDIVHMDYLKCVIKETLRLHPPVPFLVPRETSTDTKLKSYDIPLKTRVFINVWAIQRDKNLWERADEFIPERFIDNNIDFKGQDFELIPFGSGRRGCPGMVFALPLVECVVANLLYWFDWELPGGGNKEELDMTEGSGVTVNKKIPLYLLPVYCSQVSQENFDK